MRRARLRPSLADPSHETTTTGTPLLPSARVAVKIARNYPCASPVHRVRMTGRQFIARARRWAHARNLQVRFVASEGPGSHGTIYVGERKTTVKDRKKEIGKGLLAKMLGDLKIEKNDF